MGLLFYEWFTVDPGEDVADLKRSGVDVGINTFGGDMSSHVEQTFKAHPDWIYAALGRANDHTQVLNTTDKAINPVPQNTKKCGTEALKGVCIGDIRKQVSLIQAPLPRTWLRVFHPRPPLHAMIANLILYLMSQHRAAYLNAPIGPEISNLTVCAAAAGIPTTTPTSTSIAASSATYANAASDCNTDSDCTWRRCPGGPARPATCDLFGVSLSAK